MGTHGTGARAALALGVIVFALAAAGAAAAQNASTPGTLELYPTLECIGARLHYTGDADSDATAYLDWRALGGAWKRGVNLTRISNRRWAGSVLWLWPNATFEMRAVIVDPDGGGSATASAHTRRAPDSTATGASWWVDLAGNDGNSGASGSPLATLQEAANRAHSGDAIRVRPGTYYQRLVTPRAGAAQALIHLIAAAPGVVLDGSDPALLHSSAWRNDGGGVFSVPFTGWTRLVCADSLQRLYRQRNLGELQTNFNGMTSGWTLDSGRLWVKLADQSSPASHTMHVARYDVGIYLAFDYWHVAGLEIRYFGSDTVPSSAGIVTSAGILLHGAHGCLISGNHVHTIGGRGIFFDWFAADNLVDHNLCRDPRIGWWNRAVCKSHEEEIQGISMRGGRGNVIRYNTAMGTFDGIDAASDTTSAEDGAADLDIHDNLVRWTADDAIEPEKMSGINVRVWKNTIDHTYYGFSIAPNWQGPAYVLYNTVTGYTRGGFKLSLTSDGQTWLCHNTVTTTAPSTHAVWPTGEYSNKHFRNNILIGRNQQCVGDDAGESQTGNDFDGDLLYAVSSTKLFAWKGTSYTTLAALRAATGFEINGQNADPMFADSSAGNYAPLASSPAIDHAIPMPGINDAIGGAGPDVGAVEVGPLVDVATGGESAGARTLEVSPNPGRAGAAARFALVRGAWVRLVVLDLQGRRVRDLATGAFEAGDHTVRWDGRDARGHPAPPGVYLLRLDAEDAVLTRRFVLLR